MERIFTLIDKLSQQKAQGAPAANLLFTVQLLQQELLQLQKKGEQPSTRKVAVTLPFQPLTAMTAEPLVVPVIETVAPVQQTAPPVEEGKEI